VTDERQDDRIARERRRALVVGALVLVSVLVLLALLLLLGPARMLSGRELAVDFGYAGPIKPGASVRVAGIVVGSVTSVELLPSAEPGRLVRVRARIKDEAAGLVTDKARFYVTTLGVLGEHYLDVEPGRGGTPLAQGAVVEGVTLPRPDLLLPRAAGLLERADALLPSSPEAMELMRQAAALMKRVDTLLASSDATVLTADAKALLEDLRGLVHGAAVGVGDGVALRRSLERMPGVLERTDRLEASIQTTLEETDLKGLLGDVRTATAKASSLADRLQQSPLLPPERQEELRTELLAALRAIDTAGRRADRLMAVIEQKKGGAGKLFWDEAVADDLKSALRELRENPMKLLLPGR
jgi:ABC-type transporter Mla subunit MlaD